MHGNFNIFCVSIYDQLYRMFRYLWLDRQCKIRTSNCRMIHFPHTLHTHLLLSQNAASRRSQTAEEGRAAAINRRDMKSVTWRSRLDSTWHVPLKQAAVEPNGGGLAHSQRVPSTNWAPRLTRKFSPSDWHRCLHCSSPGCGKRGGGENQ